MELIEGSETSANHNRTPGKYPKEYIQNNNKPFLEYFKVDIFKVFNFKERDQVRDWNVDKKKSLINEVTKLLLTNTVAMLRCL